MITKERKKNPNSSVRRDSAHKLVMNHSEYRFPRVVFSGQTIFEVSARSRTPTSLNTNAMKTRMKKVVLSLLASSCLRDLSDPWTGFTQFTLLAEKRADGFLWSGRRLTRKQLTSRPDHLWPELWKSMGKHAKLKEKQKWSDEKLHLENARKLRGIYFIDPEDKEFKETIKNARKKLETSVAPAMPCKIMKNCGSDGSDKNKTKLACILEANEFTRMRMGNSIPHHHEDHIAGKGKISLQHYNMVHKFILMPQAMKIPAAKAAVDKEWEKLEENFGVEP